MALFAVSLFITSAYAQNTIQFGVAQAGYIAAGETQSYQFQASQGEIVYVKLTSTSGNIWPKAIIYAPSGNQLRSESNPGNTEFSVNLSESGTFTLVVGDGFNGKYTGDYSLLVQKIKAPQNSKTLKLGSLQSSSIYSIGGFDTYTFQGKENDTVHAKMTMTSGNLWPKILVYSPTGTLIRSESSPTSYESNIKLPESGTYTLIAEDGFNGKYTGDYTLIVSVVSSAGSGAGSVIGSTANPTQAGSVGSPSGQASPSTDSSLLLIGGGILVLIIIAIAVIVALRGKKKEPVHRDTIANPPDHTPDKGISHDVFISYSTEDKHIADAVCARLESRKIRCWIAPRDILPGTNYAESILYAIGSSLVFVMVFSSSANKSPHVMREVENAVNSAVPIITFRIDDTIPAPQMKYYIGPIHWLDAMSPPMEKHLEKLTDTVELLIKQSRPIDEPMAIAPIVSKK